MRKELTATGIIVLLAILGMSLIDVEIFTLARGKVVPIHSPINIGVAQGGIIDKVYVTNGSIIDKGQKIAKINDEEIKLRIISLNKEIALIKSNLSIMNNLLSGKKLLPPMRPSLLYELKKQHLNYVKDLKSLLEYVEQEKSIIQSLVDKTTLPEIRAIKIKQRLMKDKKEINKTTKEFWERLIFNLEQKELMLAKLKSALKSEKFKLKNTDIIAPKSGIINRVNFSEGEYLSRGSSFAEMVPNHDKIQIELIVNPKDIGGVKLGQKVKLKVETFNYKIFGTSDSKVTYISPSAVEPTNDGNYYLVKCELQNDFLKKGDKKFYLKNGMNVYGSIIRGKISALNYLIGPLIKSFHLFGVM